MGTSASLRELSTVEICTAYVPRISWLVTEPHYTDFLSFAVWHGLFFQSVELNVWHLDNNVTAAGVKKIKIMIAWTSIEKE